jgi:hypothetical protein
MISHAHGNLEDTVVPQSQPHEAQGAFLGKPHGVKPENLGVRVVGYYPRGNTWIARNNPVGLFIKT